MDSFREVFDLACKYCRAELSEVAYNLWIADIDPIGFDGSTVYLFIRTEFKKSIVEEKYLPLLGSAFESVLGFPVEIKFSCEETLAAPIPEPGEEPAPYVPGALPFGGEYEYTFDTFIVGSSNKFAHAASWAVASNPAKAYNPLFIYGDSGLGKTHLVCAICEEVKKNNPTFNILYVKGEEFTNELINAISHHETNTFHEKYRAADMLAVDDIQFIGGKESTQEEFFHTFNTLFHGGKQIVLTSDRPPKEIKTLEDRLRTRFEWGLLADIQAPDFETRVAIIRRKAELLNFVIPDDVSEYIANRLKNNIRQLEGVVKKMKAYKQLAGSNPTILLAQSAIKDILSDHQPLPMTVDRIITEVARTYGVTPEEVRSSKRSSMISVARQVAMYIIREVTPMSMADIGEEFNNRDHSTVVYACQQVQKNMVKDSHYKETVDDIVKNIRTM
ncbi:MAG: chromosomal replication initiator protein DnaA [Angelakisella sp.]